MSRLLKEIEVIVHEDVPSVEPSLVAESFGNKSRYFRQENGGIASTRNCSLKRATGEFVAFLDADDYFILPEKLERQLVRQLSRL